MNTEHKTELQQRMKADKKDWVAVVVTQEHSTEVKTHYNSEQHSIENIIHKVELDLMTNLHFGFKNPILVAIKEKNNPHNRLTIADNEPSNTKQPTKQRGVLK